MEPKAAVSGFSSFTELVLERQSEQYNRDRNGNYSSSGESGSDRNDRNKHVSKRSRRKDKKKKKRKSKHSAKKSSSRQPKRRRSSSGVSYNDKFCIVTTPSDQQDTPLYSYRKPSMQSIDTPRYFDAKALAPLSSVRKVCAIPNLASASVNQVNYLPITVESATQSSEPTEEVDHECKSAFTHLNSAIRSNPSNQSEEEWIAFIKAKHMIWVSQSRGRVTNVVPFDIHCSELIATCEQALRYVPQCLSIVILRLELIQVQSTQTSIDELDQAWMSELRRNPTSSILWERYLQLQLQDFNTSNEPRLRQLFGECLQLRSQLVSEILTKQHQSGITFVSQDSLLHKAKRDDVTRSELNLLDLIKLFWVMELSTGYTEIVVGLAQAFLSFNLTLPAYSKRGELPSRVRVFFSEFWESEYPRIGEPGASTSLQKPNWVIVQESQINQTIRAVSCPWVVDQVSSFGSASAANQKFKFEIASPNCDSGTERESGVIERNGSPFNSDESDIDDNEGPELRYSTVHGYRIPMYMNGHSERETSVYEHILSDAQEVSQRLYPARYQTIQNKKAKSEQKALLKAAATGLDLEHDPFYEWVIEEQKVSVKAIEPLKLSVDQDAAMKLPEACVMLEDILPVILEFQTTGVVVSSLCSLLEVLGVAFPFRSMWNSATKAPTVLVEPVHFELFYQPYMAEVDSKLNYLLEKQFQLLYLSPLLLSNHKQLCFVSRLLSQLLCETDSLKANRIGNDTSSILGTSAIQLTWTRVECEMLQEALESILQDVDLHNKKAERLNSLYEFATTRLRIATTCLERMCATDSNCQLLIWWEYACLEQNVQSIQWETEGIHKRKPRKVSKHLLVKRSQRVLKMVLEQSTSLEYLDWFVFNFAMYLARHSAMDHSLLVLRQYIQHIVGISDASNTALQLITIQNRLLMKFTEGLSHTVSQECALLPHNAIYTAGCCALYTLLSRNVTETTDCLARFEQVLSLTTPCILVHFMRVCAQVLLLPIANQHQEPGKLTMQTCKFLRGQFKCLLGKGILNDEVLLMVQLLCTKSITKIENLSNVFERMVDNVKQPRTQVTLSKTVQHSFAWEPDSRLPCICDESYYGTPTLGSLYWCCAILSELHRGFDQDFHTKRSTGCLNLSPSQVCHILFGKVEPPNADLVYGSPFNGGNLMKVLLRVRRVLIRATKQRYTNPVVYSASWLWMLFIRLELLCQRPEKAKAVMFTAVRFCSLSKTFWMKILQTMRSYLTLEECKQLVLLAKKKGILIRTNIDV